MDKDQNNNEPQLIVDFPTKKPHVSFSEVSVWNSCSWKHKLSHVDKLGKNEESVHLSFGKAVHAACEQFLKTRTMDAQIAIDYIKNEWTTNNFPDEENWVKIAKEILAEYPKFIDDQFPNWEYESAEEPLYESIEGHEIKFKGFIDGIVKITNNKGKVIYWILDLKTSNRGWFREKREDFMTKSQLILYKNFWAAKHNIPLKDIRCAFVILKKSAKPGFHCEIIPVSVGEITSQRSLKIVSNMITSVKSGIAIKNRDSCKYCEFYQTEHCT